MKKKTVLLSIVPLLICLFFIVLQIVSLNKFDKTSAFISKISNQDKNTSSTIYISYRYKEQNYNDVPLNYSNANMSVGGQETIFVNPDNPEEFKGYGGLQLLIILFFSLMLLINVFLFLCDLAESSSEDGGKTKQKEKKPLGCFTFFAVVILAGIYFTFGQFYRVITFDKITATVSDVVYYNDLSESGNKKSYFGYVDYVYNGVEYKDVPYGHVGKMKITSGPVSSTSSMKKENDTVVIYVNQKYPTDLAKTNDVFAGISFIVIGFAGILASKSMYDRVNKKSPRK